ncbi:MAG: hypothetical protein IPM64_04025 [Phycisphaerales bacterium]|nr:hypothetical protein [Phycisphaerales bacterium]
MRLRVSLCVSMCLLFVSGAAASGTADRAAARASFLTGHPGTHFYEADGWITRVYGRAFSSGASATESAERFVADHLAIFGLSAGDLAPGSPFSGDKVQPLMLDEKTGAFKFTLVYYSQMRDGLPVHGAELRLLVREEPAYPLVLAASTLRPLGEFRVDAESAANPRSDLAQAAALAAHPQMLNVSPPELLVWAGSADEIAAARLALRFDVDNGRQQLEDYDARRIIADAATGVILEDESLIVHADVHGNVTARVTQGSAADICADEVHEPMPYARIESGADVVHADAAGNFVLPTPGTDPVPISSAVRGLYFTVTNNGGTNTTLTPTSTPGVHLHIPHNDANATEFQRAEVNAYVEANIIRDLVLQLNPLYPVVNAELGFPVLVNSSSLVCNARYTQTAIEFFRAASGCVNSAFAPVVHHEYGHHLVRVGGSGQGQYGEGMSDCMSILLSDSAILGQGFQSNCGAGIRSADNTRQYPCSDSQNGVHTCGTLLSGCLWDFREALLAANISPWQSVAAPLTLNSIMLHTGTLITPQITIDFLTLDDDNGDIGDGSPHYAQIAAAFNQHNMTAPPLAPVRFVYPDGLPEKVIPTGGSSIRVRIEPIGGTPTPGTQQIHVNTGSGFVAAPMTHVSGDEYLGEFGPMACGTTAQFYFSTDSSIGPAVSHAANARPRAISAFDSTLTFSDDFQTDLGWSVVSDGGMGPSQGIWQRGVPAGGGTRSDPPTDFDGSGACWLTGNFAGNSDVDNGATRLISPALPLAGQDAVIRYARWFANNFGGTPNQDIFIVEVAPSLAGPYTVIETVGPTGASGGWVVSQFRVGDFITPTSDVRVRFIAADTEGASVVEAAVDAFSVVTLSCSPVLVGDMNCDGIVNNFDIDGFVMRLVDPAGYSALFPDCPDGNGDADGSGQVDNFDIDAFIALLLG